MTTNNLIRSVPVIFLLVVTAQFINAQPGDRSFSVVTLDNAGYADCSNHRYSMYSCTVKYPDSQARSDSFGFVWIPDLATLRLVDTLRCIPNNTNSATLPYLAHYAGSSCLSTDVLMIVRDGKDTMLISAGGSDYYSWLLDPNGFDLGLPFIFPFQKGLFYLGRLHADKSRVILHHSIYRSYLLRYYQKITPVYNPGSSHITKTKTSRRIYAINDTISVTITGQVLNNGACGGAGILWTLQKWEDGNWINQKDECCTQMDCATGPTIAKNTTFTLFVNKDTNSPDKETSPIHLDNPKGTFRLVVYDDCLRPYWTNEFTVE